MSDFKYTVTVSGDELTSEQAETVMTERINVDEDYGFPYQIVFEGPEETDDPITDAEYAEFGKRVAARLGSAEYWSKAADFLEEFDALAVVHLKTTIGSGSPDLMEFWRARADALGIEHSGNDEGGEYDPFAPHVN